MEQASSITELQRAFTRLETDVPGLSVDVVGHPVHDDTVVHPVAGFEVRLTRDDSDARLYVSGLYAELTLRQEGDERIARQAFAIKLDGTYEWEGTEFPDANELATALLGYVQYQLDAEPVG